MNKFQELLNSDKLVFLDFFAEWCGPCKMMKPILQDLKKRVGDDVTIVQIDAEKNDAAAAAFQIQAYPTLILVKNGKILWRQSGVVPAPELERIIKANS